jgi:hypothetical protein
MDEATIADQLELRERRHPAQHHVHVYDRERKAEAVRDVL